MDNCYQPNVCNCKKDCNCDEGYECCSQIYKGKDSTYGLCVKSGSCDKERGICKSREKQIIRKEENNVSENYKVFQKENYNDNDDDNDNDNCKEWKNGFWFVFCLFLIFLLIFLSKFFCKRNF